MESNNLENLKKSCIRKTENFPLGWKERLSAKKKIRPIRIGKKKSLTTRQTGRKKSDMGSFAVTQNSIFKRLKILFICSLFLFFWRAGRRLT